MNPYKATKLLAHTLAVQAEPSRVQSKLDEAGLREILVGKKRLNEQQRRLLLHSPAERRQLYFLADVVRAETYACWKQAGISTTLTYQAAADKEIRPIIIDFNPDFTLTLFPLNDRGDKWTVHLKLSQRLTDLSARGVRLVDDLGEIWITGRPDEQGELSCDWQLLESPQERLRRCRLNAQPL